MTICVKSKHTRLSDFQTTLYTSFLSEARNVLLIVDVFIWLTKKYIYTDNIFLYFVHAGQNVKKFLIKDTFRYLCLSTLLDIICRQKGEKIQIVP
jgi:hypothetical protein